MEQEITNILDKFCGRPNEPCEFIYEFIRSKSFNVAKAISGTLVKTTDYNWISEKLASSYAMYFVEVQKADAFLSNEVIATSLKQYEKNVLAKNIQYILSRSQDEIQRELQDKEQIDNFSAMTCYLLLYKGDMVPSNLVNVYTAIPRDIIKYLEK